jgi:2-octaprenylphenol hydroxylase
MNKHYDFIIIGAGVVGLSLAVALAKKNYSVAILDKQDKNINSKRVYAINLASQNFWRDLGININGCDYLSMDVWGHNTNEAIKFSNALIDMPKLGSIIYEQHILDGLFKVLETSVIDYFNDQALVNITYNKKWIISTATNNFTASWIVGADGANSWVRDKLNAQVETSSYNQEALTCTVQITNTHNNIAYQTFSEQGIIALLPLENSKRCSVVWSTTPEIINDLKNLESNHLQKQLTEFFFHKVGNVVVLDKPVSFPLMMRHAKKIIDPTGWLLVGDAAHTIHPLAGLGLNLGMADIILFLKQLNKKYPKFLSNSNLGNYARTRNFQVWRTIKMMGTLKKLFVHQDPIIKNIRSLGLNTINNSNLMKKWLISEASGVNL